MKPEPLNLEPEDGELDPDCFDFDSKVNHQPPTYTMEDQEVAGTDFAYPVRTEGAYVVSGPLGRFHPTRQGRRFKTPGLAEADCRERFGERFVRMVRDGEALALWAAEVKKP